MRVLLVTPPMTQLNTPYPATAYLTGFLRKQGIDVAQADPAIELVLRLFSREGLEKIASVLDSADARRVRMAAARNPGRRLDASDPVSYFLANRQRYIEVIEPVIRFLQGKDPSLALRIVSRGFLPEGPRFRALEPEDGADPIAWAFGSLGTQDAAKYLASLMIDDLSDVVREGVDPRFELSRYGEKLAASAPSFDPLAQALGAEPTLVDRILDEISAELIATHQPGVLGLTVPFPGNVYGALRIARRARELSPSTRIVLGGGYVNTELRELREPRIFDFVDFIALDDGEKPFLCILEHLQGKRSSSGLLRTFVREEGRVVFRTTEREHDIPHRETGVPSYQGLPLDRYLSIFEMLNPMHRIWSDGRWNKITLAHGCYWRKCSFCDVTLDYISRYDPASADPLVERILQIVAETGQSGFHLVDEAAPPALLGALSRRLIERGVVISWWGNIRFEKTFTPELASLMARAGCVAVSGGLEVASDRLLRLMRKGVTVEQVARVTRALTDAGIMVHAYLMYGFPTQTVQETVDALERVRQLFAAGCIQSAYWHRFSATAHSPIGKDPGKYGIRIPAQPETRFARNDLPFEDPAGVDHDLLGVGLRRALYNYMHGAGLDRDVRFWFRELRAPRTRVSPTLVEDALGSDVTRPS